MIGAIPDIWGWRRCVFAEFSVFCPEPLDFCPEMMYNQIGLVRTKRTLNGHTEKW